MADNYPHAARKHVFDSEALLAAGRYDGAGYLAGYAVECTLKTLILVETGKQEKHHRLNELSATALSLASTPGQKTAKYLSGPTITSLVYGSPGWFETLRYMEEGAVSQADSTAWVTEARRLHDTVILPMTLDGVIS